MRQVCRGVVLLFVVAAALLGCSPEVGDVTAATAPSVPVSVPLSVRVSVPVTGPVTTVGQSIEKRGFDVFVPSSYDGSTAAALVILLHGYTSSGLMQEEYFGMEPLAEARGFLYVHPDGTSDSRGNQFWNATDACCNLTGATVDDSGYLAALIEDVQHTYNVDPKRIYLAGHSNGGFMSYRMACDHAGTVAAIASLAGATFADPTMCRPSEPVNILQIHGTSDAVIGYDGGSIIGNTFPAAQTTVATWAAYNRCGQTLDTSGPELDLEADLGGAETQVQAYAGCPAGGDVELWTIEGGAHSPHLSTTFAASVIDFLLAHPKP